MTLLIPAEDSFLIFLVHTLRETPPAFFNLSLSPSYPALQKISGAEPSCIRTPCALPPVSNTHYHLADSISSGFFRVIRKFRFAFRTFMAGRTSLFIATQFLSRREKRLTPVKLRARRERGTMRIEKLRQDSFC